MGQAIVDSGFGIRLFAKQNQKKKKSVINMQAAHGHGSLEALEVDSIY